MRSLCVKVLVASMGRLGTYVSREFYYIMQDLIRVHGWRQIEPSVLPRNPASVRATLLDALGEIPEVILFWEAYDLCVAMRPALLDIGCRECVFVDDLHWRDDADREVKSLGLSLCDTILSTYAYIFDDYYPELRNRKKIVWAPHSASPDFVLPFNDRPQNAVLLSGAVNEHYPLRQRMKKLRDDGRYPIRLHEHPGYAAAYDYETDERVGAGYARIIHQYKVAFTDAAWLRYVVAKYFEIPATGALLLADGAVREQLNELGLLENVHYIAASAKNLEEQIQYVLDPIHDEEINAIRRRGQELVSSRHKTSDRANLIDRVCT
jgi:Glycosyl transferases group 1